MRNPGQRCRPVRGRLYGHQALWQAPSPSVIREAVPLPLDTTMRMRVEARVEAKLERCHGFALSTPNHCDRVIWTECGQEARLMSNSVESQRTESVM